MSVEATKTEMSSEVVEPGVSEMKRLPLAAGLRKRVLVGSEICTGLEEPAVSSAMASARAALVMGAVLLVRVAFVRAVLLLRVTLERAPGTVVLEGKTVLLDGATRDTGALEVLLVGWTRAARALAVLLDDEVPLVKLAVPFARAMSALRRWRAPWRV